MLETPRLGGVPAEVNTTHLPRKIVTFEQIKQINDFIAISAVPNLRRFLLDNDKILGACTNIVYYVAAPVMKGRSPRYVVSCLQKVIT